MTPLTKKLARPASGRRGRTGSTAAEAVSPGRPGRPGPTMPPAWTIDPVNGDQISGGGAANLAAIAGYPHLSVPMGLVKGLPVGLSFYRPQMVEGPAVVLGLCL